MRQLLRALFAGKNSTQANIQRIDALRTELRRSSDQDLRNYARSAAGRLEIIAAAAAVAARVLGLEMFDVQLRGALAMTEGKISEMQTGEGKTLAAVPAVICYAKTN